MSTPPNPDTMPTNEVVAENIKAALYEKRLTQSRLARQMGHQPPWLSERMSGKYAFRTSDIDEVAKALEIPASTLTTPPGKRLVARPVA